MSLNNFYFLNESYRRYVVALHKTENIFKYPFREQDDAKIIKQKCAWNKQLLHLSYRIKILTYKRGDEKLYLTFFIHNNT